METFTVSNSPGSDPMAVLIASAAAGDRQAMRHLVMALTPAIRTAVASVLARASSGRAPRAEVEDATQTVLLALFADRGRVLQQWDPSRGVSLEAFVALLAKRETTSLLRSRRRSPFTEDPTLNEDLDQNAVPRMGPESETISRDMLDSLALAVRAKLSAKGNEVFELMFMRGLPPEEVADLSGMSIEAVYAWKSRLSRQVREILADLARVPPTVPPKPLDDSNPGLRDPALETMVRLRRPNVEGQRSSSVVSQPPAPAPSRPGEDKTPPLGTPRTPGRRGGSSGAA